MSIEETRTKIKELCEKLGLDANKVLREYGVHHGVIEMLETTLAEQSKGDDNNEIRRNSQAGQ